MNKKSSSGKKRFLVIFISAFSIAALVQIIVPKSPVSCGNSRSCSSHPELSVQNKAVGIFNKQTIIPPLISLQDEQQPVLGTSDPAGKKHIFVDLSQQKLYAYEDNILFMETSISSGKWFPTPTGEFDIWVKLRATRMSGGVGDDYYDLPNVPYVLFFYNKDVSQATGFSLHGAYWHNNFGHPMSHGCVNMRITDAEKLYHWANPVTTGPTTYASKENTGTKVTIYGEAPI
ncbi:hypothetical protein A2866_01795 [Candidatus Roizmanbacteria bacterium RIFCSPHIGHO2_01_FULL_39_8]|uniref:L,D-TPase catalytic domain-containing protein n=3 Tax=Candidatus Roizmaniibacteriota TaxID=1752723 RepID=A0A1F7GLQ1_9BACT|nr:MAG: hypothetical protein A2866_01795 [Candidatus Roizmanbacteria bacterium RIFCSPHIGHO2_01_FULL_39_8]OGK25932.1 MAG: hypothetical protein A3C28_00640 [Candidatus Roizmanbacteria bacterium RIFCSPHIGHO2_02_FULL_39_9]OGK37653.1 MAG: hypothetical protein A3F60_01125 [Candidatus Roizmanbacteria bacterium RIFCSPHIGHO2_12_FULL_39_8]